MQWKRKKENDVGIDRETGSNEIFAILKEIESEAESDVENLKNTQTQDSSQKKEFQTEMRTLINFWHPRQLFILKVSNESELPPKKKLKAKITEVKWKQQPKVYKRQEV